MNYEFNKNIVRNVIVFFFLEYFITHFLKCIKTQTQSVFLVYEHVSKSRQLLNEKYKLRYNVYALNV